eukprot:2604609-Karenia_brevis.AAC.1
MCHANKFPEPDLDHRDCNAYEQAPSFEEKILQRHPRNLSDDEFVFLSSRVHTRDQQRQRIELREWIKANARGVVFNESGGYPRV